MTRVGSALLIAHFYSDFALAFAQPGTRPVRVVLIVDATDAIRQPIGLIRKALTVFVESIDARHEMMLVTVAGTPPIACGPTLDRQQVLKSVNGMFGTSRIERDAPHYRRCVPSIRAARGSPPGVRRSDGGRIRIDAEHQPAADHPHVTNHFLEHRWNSARRQAECANGGAVVPRRQPDRAAGQPHDRAATPAARSRTFRRTACSRSCSGRPVINEAAPNSTP